MKTIKHNGVPCIEARVHMVATDGVGALSTRKSSGVITAYIKDLGNIYQPQHLYITTDEDIKEGDWIYETDLNTINQAGKNYKPNDNDRKIIATTDPKIYFNDIGEGVIEYYGKLPQIPQSFIKEYCKAGGIDRVMVEVEEIIIQDAFKRRPDYNTYRPKTDSKGEDV
jgi:hypothetical protein